MNLECPIVVVFLVEHGKHFREPDVDRFAGVVERRGVQDDGAGACDHGSGENPQEQSVQHHGYVLPVLFHLKIESSKYIKLPKSLNALHGEELIYSCNYWFSI